MMLNDKGCSQVSMDGLPLTEIYAAQGNKLSKKIKNYFLSRQVAEQQLF